MPRPWIPRLSDSNCSVKVRRSRIVLYRWAASPTDISVASTCTSLGHPTIDFQSINTRLTPPDTLQSVIAARITHSILTCHSPLPPHQALTAIGCGPILTRNTDASQGKNHQHVPPPPIPLHADRRPLAPAAPPLSSVTPSRCPALPVAPTRHLRSVMAPLAHQRPFRRLQLHACYQDCSE